jgi:serine/threonine protein kinase
MHDMPQKLGPYKIRREIGSGGMGVVYEGWDARLNRRVAVKTLWPVLAQRPEARERFLREARAAAAVSHPNVTQIYDIGEEGGQVFFAMEYLEARSLQQILEEQGKLPADGAIDIARQTARGLRAAAEVGIIHRDVKPSNLVFNSDGILKVTDFGLAKHVMADKDLTLDGQTIGTPKYVSPEQASGGHVDARSDIYSLGATLYEMVTGRPPFEGSTPMEVMLKHVREPVPPVQTVNPTVPRQLTGLIHRMLSKQPGARPQSYDELLIMLDRVAAGRTIPGTTSNATIKIDTVPALVLSDSRPEPNFAGRLFLFASLGMALIVVGGLILQSAQDEQERPAPLPLRVDSAPLTPVESGRDADSLRVRPIDRPSFGSPPVVEFQQPVEGGGAVLEIVDAEHQITEDGRMIVTGEVTNSGDSRATNTKVRISLTDPLGELVNSTEVFVTPERLSEGAKGHFEAVFPDPEQTVRIVFELNWIS